MRKRGVVLAVVVLSLCLWLPATESEAKGDWEWTLVPYLWASDISMEVKIAGEPVLETDIDFGDLLDKVDLALTLHFEGRKGPGGFLLDMTVISLSNEMTFSGSGGPSLPPDGTVVNAEVDLGIYEVGGFYRPGGEKTGLDILAGIRYVGIDQNIDITLPFPPDDPIGTRIESSPSVTDGFIGLRYTTMFGQRWGFGIRGDIAAGGTEQTLNGIIGISYHFGKSGRYALRLGYRYMTIEIEEDEGGVKIETDMTMSGIYGGLVFQW